MKVPLEDLTTPKVIVAVHADKGIAGTFDFDMMNKEMSPDRPFFVDGTELAKVVDRARLRREGRPGHGVDRGLGPARRGRAARRSPA